MTKLDQEIQKALIEQITILDGQAPRLAPNEKLPVKVVADKLTKSQQFVYNRKILLSVVDGKIKRHKISRTNGNPLQSDGVEHPPDPEFVDTEKPQPPPAEAPKLTVKPLEVKIDTDYLDDIRGPKHEPVSDFPEIEPSTIEASEEEDSGAYVVVRIDNSPVITSRNAPTIVHENVQDAVKEATRLSVKHIGSRFYIFKATSVFEAEAIVTGKELT